MIIKDIKYRPSFLGEGLGGEVDVEEQMFIKDIKYRSSPIGEGKGVRLIWKNK